VANFYYTMCHNWTHPNKKTKCFRLFQNNNKIFLIIKSWHTWQHIICSHCSPKSHILITSDNMYMTNQMMKVYFIDFFFIQNLLSFAISSNVTIKILVANVACNKKLVVGTNCKMIIFYYWILFLTPTLSILA
jgi:hypothetical protein